MCIGYAILSYAWDKFMTERNNHVFVIVNHTAFSQAKRYNINKRYGIDKLSLLEHSQQAASIYTICLTEWHCMWPKCFLTHHSGCAGECM